MVDIHSHVLPGMDDGARTAEESLEMLKIAAASGTTDLVATPHANAQFPFDPARVQQAFSELSARAAGLLTVHLGSDFHLHMDNLQDALVNPTKYTINHGPYLLVELPDFLGLSVIREQLRALIHARIQPIITHPERNFSLQPRMDSLKEWVKDGCLVQVTAQSFLGRFGTAARRAAESLMNARLVHVVASDAHDCTERPPDLSAAFRHVSARWGKGRAEALFANNPAAVVSSDTLPSVRRRFRFFSFSK